MSGGASELNQPQTETALHQCHNLQEQILEESGSGLTLLILHGVVGNHARQEQIETEVNDSRTMMQ